MLTNHIIQRWVSYVERTYSRHTHASYAAAVWRFKDFAPKYARDITLEHLENYLASLGHLSNTSVNNSITALKSFGKWCEDHSLPNPARKLKYLQQCPKQRVLTSEEYEKVLAVCTPSELDIILFLSHTGLRAREFLSLDGSNLSPDHKFLHIIGKGKKPQTIYLNETCHQIIDRHPNLNFSKSNYMSLYRLCLRLGRLAGIPPFAPHSLRHWFATQLMREGVSVFFISKCLRHSNSSITEKVYISFIAERDLSGVTDILDKS